MQSRVTAILVAHAAHADVERALVAAADQSRPPEHIVVVDCGVAEGSSGSSLPRSVSRHVRVGRMAFGSAVDAGLRSAPEAEGDDEWLWLLAHDNVPEPGALDALMRTVAVSPSVAVAGPKVMRADAPGVIARYGETMTRSGASVRIVENELDQGQHDRLSDVLAVSEAGMLVRRSVWVALGGFDPALPGIDAALDFCVRARLAGHRVVAVPRARVTSAGGPESFGRRVVRPRVHARLARTAQLHRRLVYARAWALPLHWLSLLPLAAVRAVWHLLRKRPGRVLPEFTAAVAALAGARVIPARSRLARSRRVGWNAIAPLRLSAAEGRERRASDRLYRSEVVAADEAPRLDFFGDGGAWPVFIAAIIGLVAFSPLLGATALEGGALAPLSASVATLWESLGYSWRDVGLGFAGAADPFAYVLALLGSLTFWNPSASVVVLWFAALPLAALAGWTCAARFTDRRWVAGAAALVWALAPPFTSALVDGRIGPVIAHVLLPWLVAATVAGARTWTAAATASLLFAATAASAPSLAPALVVAWLTWTLARPSALVRLVGIPIPALVLFAPLIVQQLVRGTPLALLADPGAPVGTSPASTWQLALGAPASGLLDWTSMAERLGLPGGIAALVLLALVAPVLVLALAGPFVRPIAIAPFTLALIGMLSAIIASNVEVTVADGELVPVWPGSTLSLYWLGMLGSAIFATAALGRVAAPIIAIGATASLVAVAPLLAAPLLGSADVRPASARALPAFVVAEAQVDPRVGTLVLGVAREGAVTAVVHRGEGTTLDEHSTLASTGGAATAGSLELATLAANLVSTSGFAAAEALDDLGIAFVLLDTTAPPELDASLRGIERALDSQPALTPVGQTATGLLWRQAGDEAPSTDRGRVREVLESGVLAIQGGVFALAVLLAVPTGVERRRRVDGDDEPMLGEAEEG